MKISSGITRQIHEDVLQDPRYPVHLIADQLRPYLQILLEQFHPEEVILFGSHAYGQPTPDSDVDLLIVKPINQSRLKDKVAIRRAWWPLMRRTTPLSFDLLLISPEEFNSRKYKESGFHAKLKNRGLRVV
jgi:predicted nucleotidyltransferase